MKVLEQNFVGSGINFEGSRPNCEINIVGTILILLVVDQIKIFFLKVAK